MFNCGCGIRFAWTILDDLFLVVLKLGLKKKTSPFFLLKGFLLH